MSATRYQYIKIGKTYVCLQKNPAMLAWFLYLRNKSLGLRSLGLGRQRAAGLVKEFTRHWLRPRSNTPALELPVCGHICLQVHRGYRVFNLHRKSVYKIFSPEVDATLVANEMNEVRNASLLDFAPAVRQWNLEDRWYEEEYVVGLPVSRVGKLETRKLLETYRQDIGLCIENMVLLQTPLSVGLGEYVDKVTDILEDSRLSSPEVDQEKLKAIRHFIELGAERLRPEGDRQVDLVFTHGDFGSANILRTKDGIRIIDWEHAGRRSLLSDLYNFFLTEIYYKRPTTDVIPVLQKALSSLELRLTSKAPDVARTLPSMAETYRKLYYLERVRTLLERELTEKRLDVNLLSIDVFNRFDEAIAQFGAV